MALYTINYVDADNASGLDFDGTIRGTGATVADPSVGHAPTSPAIQDNFTQFLAIARLADRGTVQYSDARQRKNKMPIQDITSGTSTAVTVTAEESLTVTPNTTHGSNGSIGAFAGLPLAPGRFLQLSVFDGSTRFARRTVRR